MSYTCKMENYGIYLLKFKSNNFIQKINSKKNPIIKNALILTIITLIAGLGLGFVYEITKIVLRLED